MGGGSSSQKVVEVSKCSYCSNFIPISRFSAHENGCDMRPKKCSYCSNSIPISGFSAHENKCEMRPKKCSYCSNFIPATRFSAHERDCDMRPASCPHCDENFPKKDLTNHKNSCVLRPSKIKSAVSAMVLFLNKMMGTCDRCSVVAFNDQYHPLVNLGNEQTAIMALAACLRICKGSTNLWDAVAVSVIQFLSTADKSRPWILIVLTDGEDTGSKCSLDKVSQLVTAFNGPANNFVFIIGLGRNVNEQQLRNLCNSSRSIYQHASDTQALQLIFVLLAVQATEGVQVNIANIQANGIEATYARVQRAVQMRRQAIDFLLLLDISGSMSTE